MKERLAKLKKLGQALEPTAELRAAWGRQIVAHCTQYNTFGSCAQQFGYFGAIT